MRDIRAAVAGGAFGLLAAIAISATPAHAAASTVNVYESTATAEGWGQTFQRDGGKLEWTEEGVAFSTPLSNDKITFGKAFTQDLDSITALNYVIKHGPDGTSDARQRLAINLTIDYNGAADGGYTNLVYEPVYNDGGFDAWRGGDAIWWSSNPIPAAPNRDTFVKISDIIKANPDAVIQLLTFNQGGGNAGLADTLVSTSFNGVTYNFKKTAPVIPTEPPVEEPTDNGGVIVTPPTETEPTTTTPAKPQTADQGRQLAETGADATPAALGAGAAALLGLTLLLGARARRARA